MKRRHSILLAAVLVLLFASSGFAATEQGHEAAGEGAVEQAVEKAVPSVAPGEELEGHTATVEEHGAAAVEGEQEGHGEAEGHGHAITPAKLVNFGLRVLNFVIFIGIIWYAAGKKIAAFFKGRRTQIRQDLDDLDVRRAGAEKSLKDVERRIANMEQERESILAEAREQGERLKTAIVEKAEKDAEALREQAKRTAENEAKSALDAMRAEMAELVVAEATEMLKKQLKAKDHEQLVDDYLTKVVLN